MRATNGTGERADGALEVLIVDDCVEVRQVLAALLLESVWKPLKTPCFWASAA